jgi:8-oxo-dGTP diphosphatase
MDPPAPFHHSATRRVRETVRVGVGVVVLQSSSSSSDGNNNDNCRIYAGIRRSSHGAGTLALPGGHLELYETWEDCARREVKEEMNVELENVQFIHVTNDPMHDEEKHYVTIFMAGRLAEDAVVTNMETNKCDGWQAFSLDELRNLSTLSGESSTGQGR